MRYGMLVLMLVMMSACEAFDWLPQEPAGTLLDDRSIIFSEATARDLTWAADYTVDNQLADKDGAWEPTAADIEMLEAALADHIANDERAQTMEVDPALTGYYRQFFGFSIAGKRYIYGAYFCQHFDFEWQHSLIFVMDGGSCFVDMAYDVESDEIASMYIHGEA